MCILLFAWHFFAVTVGWKNLNLPGNEFRQTQTAITAYFIQIERDFSLAYPTPVLGKPWSVPLEFPLYQWSVVILSDWSKLSLTAAGRTVSIACFYLFLPALGLLLVRLRLSSTAQICIFALILTCPIYIFYSRAFLIETMALMFGAWYLAALMEAVERRSLLWTFLAIATGTGAGLVKITTFFAFLLPAGAWAVSRIWQFHMPSERGKRQVWRTIFWISAIHVVPIAAALCWVSFTDRIKSLNSAAEFLTSGAFKNITFGVGRRFDLELWQQHFDLITDAIMPPASLGIALLAFALGSGRYARLIGASLLLFFLIQLVHPILYAWHDYYYVAIGYLLLISAALSIARLIEGAGWRRWTGWALGGLLITCQVEHYLGFYFGVQRVPSDGTSGLHLILRDQLDAADILVVAGDDWSSIIPYYARHRALMISGQLQLNSTLLRQSCAELAGERVGALILKDRARSDRRLVEYAAAYFDIDPTPALTWNDSIDVYLPVHRRSTLLATIEEKARISNPRYREVGLHPYAAPQGLLTGRVLRIDDLAPTHGELFGAMSPLPIRFRAWASPFRSTGPSGEPRFFAHPDFQLWFTLPAGEHRLTTTIALEPSSYKDLAPGEATDGVDLVAAAVFADGRREELRRQNLDPVRQPAHRGSYPIDWSFSLQPGAELELAVLPGPAGDKRRDWSTLGPITID